MTSIHSSFESVVPQHVPSGNGLHDGRGLEGRAWRWFAGYALCLLIASFFGDGTAANVYSAVGTLSFLPLNLGATYWLFRAARNPLHESGERDGLRLLGVMYLCTAIGNTIWSIETMRGVDPRFSTTDLFYIASYIIGTAALSRFPLMPRGPREVRSLALDGACVMIAMGALVWTFIISPIDWAAGDRIALAFSVAYPVTCIVLLGMLCRLIMRQGANQRYTDIAIIAAALFAQCTIDLILELDYRNTITALTAWVAAICPALYIVIVFSAERVARRRRAHVEDSSEPAINPTNLLPAIAAVSVYAVLIWAVQSDRRPPLSVLLTAAILLNLLFLVKQTLAARENAILVRQRAEAESRARYEALAREGQKLEAVGRLAGGIAHDFNNLLTTVLANSEFALSQLRPGAVGHDEVSDIRGAALRAAELIRQLLAFSRKSVIAPVRLQPDLLLRDMERLLQRLAGESCSLRLDLPPGLGSVQADPSQLEQAVANLVTNARDAMPQGGPIVISGCNAVLDDAQAARIGVAPGRYVALAVQDHGTGIAPDVRDQIFEPFFTTKPRGKGTGLGLASVYGIMRQSDGAVHVDTEPGTGSRFTLYLPQLAPMTVTPQAPGVVVPVPAAIASGHGTTILLVEDEPSVRQVTARILESEGHRVITAGDASSARAALDAHGDAIALVITDVVMPGDSGVILAAEVHARWPAIPVLFISGYSDGDLPTGAIPADDLLQKPFSGGTLLTRVASKLQHRRGARSAARIR